MPSEVGEASYREVKRGFKQPTNKDIHRAKGKSRASVQDRYSATKLKAHGHPRQTYDASPQSSRYFDSSEQHRHILGSAETLRGRNYYINYSSQGVVNNQQPRLKLANASSKSNKK